MRSIPYFENSMSGSGSSNVTPTLKIDPSKPLEVYRNLNNGHLSVRQRQNGKMRVLFWTDYILLKDCTFVVRPGGRRNVLKNRKKEVHAFVKGYFCPLSEEQSALPFEWDGVTYNPYKFSTFVFRDNHEPVKYAKFADVSMLPGTDDIVSALFCS